MSESRTKPSLPIATGDFRPLRALGQLYVDKTRRIASLLRPEYRFVFLARPRRFGKSLLVSTLEALFKGERALFAGTWIHDSDWAWEPHAVLRLDMTELDAENAAELKESLRLAVSDLCGSLRATPSPEKRSGAQLLSYLIRQLARQGPVAVLIDEYDAPILKNLAQPDQLPGIRDALRQFYGILKARDADLRFAFLTGVTRFARTSIFSGLNNLTDISFDPAFSDLLGFTAEELDRYLAPYMEDMAHAQRRSRRDVQQALQEWYDGYLFAEGGVRVYNPYSTLHSLHRQQLDNYWAESATPVFLTRLILARRRDLDDLVGQKAQRATKAFFHWENPSLLATMYQTGYLTLQETPDGEYVLAFPNREVEQTFAETLLEEFLNFSDAVEPAVAALGDALRQDDYDAFFRQFNALLRRVPHPLQVGNHAYYQLFLPLTFILLGYATGSERSHYRGRMDTVVEMADKIVVLEYKVNGTAVAALDQLEARGYRHEFLDRGKRVVGIGVNFDKEARQATEWLTRTYQ